MYCVILDYYDNDEDGIFRTISTDFDDYDEAEQLARQYCDKPYLAKNLLKLLDREELIEKIKTCQVSIEASGCGYYGVSDMKEITF